MPEGANEMIITLTGSNSFRLKAELDSLVSAFLAEHGDMGLERLDGEEAEYDRMRESLESMPFLASKKLVVLRRPSANKQFSENISELLTVVPETTDVILVEPKLDKRSSYYKTLKKQTEYKEFTELDEHGLARWLVDEAKSRGGKLQTADASLIVKRIGTNQQMLERELQKLLDYDENITKESIMLLTEPTPQSTIFDLLDAALKGNAKQALELYEEQRLQKVEPIQIIALLGWQLHVLAVIKTAGDQRPEETARKAKINPYVLRKSSGIAGRLSLAELRQLIHDVHSLDVRLKQESIDADEALRQLIIRLSK